MTKIVACLKAAGVITTANAGLTAVAIVGLVGGSGLLYTDDDLVEKLKIVYIMVSVVNLRGESYIIDYLTINKEGGNDYDEHCLFKTIN